MKKLIWKEMLYGKNGKYAKIAKKSLMSGVILIFISIGIYFFCQVIVSDNIAKVT
jgi:hypothetical protein